MSGLNLTQLSGIAHANAQEKGFYGDVRLITDLFTNDILSKEEYDLLYARCEGSRIALIHSEASESLEAIRKGEAANEAEELADVIIRILDYAGWKGIDLQREVVEKMKHNETRGFKHGGKRL